MRAVRIVSGRAVPLDRSDVDTDQIIPSDWLKQVERTGFEKGLFSEWRDDRNFVLNDERFAGANILIAGPNFGTGSSREHAVWALRDWGFRAIIAPRFGDIFRGNALKDGLLPVELSLAEVETLWALIESEPTLPVAVDLQERQVRAGEYCLPFPLDDFSRWRLLEGLDDIGLTLRHEAAIDAYEHGRPEWTPAVS
jgi:3-isopropylmalate/(R)-2-methylmalate dehydratase small subunit